MAYIRKRGDKWSVTVYLGTDPQTGKSRQKVLSGFTNKTEARNAARDLEKDVKDKTFVNESRIGFPDFADEWLRAYELVAKISSVRARTHQINKLKHYFKHIALKDITKKLYQDAIVSMLRNEGLAEQTVEGIHTSARMIFKKAREWDLVKLDPTEFAIIPKKKKTVEELENEEAPAKYMEKEELKRFLYAAQEIGLPNDQEMFSLMAYTGMRVGEICALKWKDINWEQQTVSITKTYYNDRNNTLLFKLLPPKTPKSARTIGVDPAVLDLLKRLHLRHKEAKLALGKHFHDLGFVFIKWRNDKRSKTKIETDYIGYPECPKQVDNRMQRLLKAAEIPTRLGPHSLRHTHTSLLAEARVGLQEIMDRLGHTDDDTTKNVYLHVTKEMKKNAVEKFSALMRSV